MHTASSLRDAAGGEVTVFVDAAPISERHLTGIGRYTARLAMAVWKENAGQVRFVANGAELVAPASLEWSPDQDLARWARRLWRGGRVPLAEVELPSQCLGLFCCLRTRERQFPTEVSVLHDFTPLLVPWTHTEATRREFGRYFARDLLAADGVITHSQATRADARWLTDVDPARIVVAPPGPSLCVERHLDARPVTHRPDVGLVVSTLEPRKNPEFLLRWFHETDVLPDGSELWWVGPAGWLTSRRRVRIRRRRGRRVRFLGVVSDVELCRLYRTAGWSACASLYEGFGLPVLDALRHGAPVLSAYHSSLREFDLPGVFPFDPYDPATLDAAWRAMREAGGPAAVAPLATLDDRYQWGRVARAVLGFGASQTRVSHAA